MLEFKSAAIDLSHMCCAKSFTMFDLGAVLQLKNGAVVEGIFHTLKIDPKDVNVVLKWARTIRDPNSGNNDRHEAAEKPCSSKTIYGSDLVQIIAKDIKMNPEDLGSVTDDHGGLETDAAISRGRGG